MRTTDGQTDMVIPVYPPNFVAGGIIIILQSRGDLITRHAITICLRKGSAC